MKKSFYYFLLVTCFFVGCTKNEIEDTIPEPPEEKAPLRVMQSILTRMDGDKLVSDTSSFTYDDDGRVTSRTYPGGVVIERYTYVDGKLTSVKSEGSNGTSEVLEKIVYSPNGDTIALDFKQQPTSPIDTVRLTYIFKNNQHTDFWTYLHKVEHDCTCNLEHHLQKEKIYYNAQGNVMKTTIETPPDHIEADRSTVLAWDDKNNPKYAQPKLNALFLGLNLPLESSSLHNPTKYTDGTTTYELEMTYNNEGYPLTYKFKNNDYVTVELVYNR